jgi:putative FmdB family regulatory protein
LPLYPYRCTQCGHRFEKIQNFSAEPETECPKCHGLLERPLTAPRLHFKGAGWYVNDYASKSSEPASESSSSDSSAPAAKTETAAPAPASTPAAAPAAAPSSSTTSSSTPSSGS